MQPVPDSHNSNKLISRRNLSLYGMFLMEELFQLNGHIALEVNYTPIVSKARAHGHSTITPHFSPYWALTVCKYWNRRGQYLWMGLLLGTCTCTYAHSYIEHVAWLFRQITWDTRTYGTIEPESWLKLLFRIRERIDIVYIIIIFVSVLVGFVIAPLSWLMLPGHLPGSEHLPFEQPGWALAQETTALAIDNQQLS